MTPLDLYDRILSELEGVTFEDEHADTYPTDEEVQWAAQAFDAAEESAA